MTIKSDIWLRRMAEEQQMIEPFLPELVREIKPEDLNIPIRNKK